MCSHLFCEAEAAAALRNACPAFSAEKRSRTQEVSGQLILVMKGSVSLRRLQGMAEGKNVERARGRGTSLVLGSQRNYNTLLNFSYPIPLKL